MKSTDSVIDVVEMFACMDTRAKLRATSTEWTPLDIIIGQAFVFYIDTGLRFIVVLVISLQRLYTI